MNTRTIDPGYGNLRELNVKKLQEKLNSVINEFRLFVVSRNPHFLIKSLNKFVEREVITILT